MKKLIGKTVKNTSESAHNLHIEFEDGTTLEVGLDCYDFERYQLETEINEPPSKI